MIIVYNLILWVSLITIFVIGGIFYKKNPSIFMKMDNTLSVNALFKYMLGRTSYQTILGYMNKNLRLKNVHSKKYTT